MDETNYVQEQAGGDPASTQPPVMAPARKIGRFAASRLITKASWGLLKKDKEILWFPVISAIVMLILVALAGAAVFFLALSGNLKNLETENRANYYVGILISFVWYFVTTFVAIFFEAGIITVVKGRLEGKDLTFSDGLGNSFRHMGKIAQWAAVSATVGVILQMISERSRIVGKIIVAILGAAWSILTFFIAPILIVEDISIKESLQKSAGTIRKVWGETVIVNVGVSMFFGLLILAGFFLALLTIFTMKMAIIASAMFLFLIYMLILVVISSTLSVIFRLVLYEYANTGRLPEGFSEEIVSLAFRQDTRSNKILGIGGM